MKREKMIILPQVNTCGRILSKKWFIYYSVRDPRDGKMKRFKDYAGLHKIKDASQREKAALLKAQELSTKLKAGWTPFDDDDKVIYADKLQYKMVADIYKNRRISNKTFHYYASKFLDDRVGQKAQETYRTYQSKLRTFAMWLDEKALGSNDIASIHHDDIIEFFKFLINDRKRSGNTIKKYKQLIFAVFEEAISDGQTKINPVYKLPECKRINDNAARPVYKMDIELFKERIQPVDPQLWMAIEFQYYTFIRPGNELRNMKIGDTDFGRGIIYIDRENFKTRRENIKEIPEQFLLKIRNEYQLHTLNRDWYVFGKNGKPGPFMISKNNLRGRFNKFRKALNMPTEYKFYSWKHTGGVAASEAGVPEKDISDQMGHTNLNTTSHYLKAKGGRRIESIRRHYPTLGE